MKKIFLLLLTACLLATAANAQKKTVVREYIYQANEADSKLTARAFATRRLHEELLREVGEFLQVERTLDKRSVMKNGKEELTEDFSENIMAITAGVVEMKILDEVWNGKTYYIEAQMTVDPDEVRKRIAEVLSDKQKTKELNESRKRILAAEKEAERLRKELALAKNKNNETLKQTYQQQVDAISAEEYFSRAYFAYENEWYELAIEYYQKVIDAYPNHATAYNNMGVAYAEFGKPEQALRCYQRALTIDSNNATAYYNMGSAHTKRRDYK